MVKRFVARCFLWLMGWEPEGAPPDERRFVLVGAPHTSNWDLAYFLALITVFDVKASWMAKHALFRPPLGWLLRRLGGIPVVRHRHENAVSQMTRAFEVADSMVLAVAAEGTRKVTTHWKSGFYHIARSAGVPIVLGYMDYARRRGGFGPAIHPTGDVRRDMDEIRRFYSDKVGRHPDQFGEIRLLEESDQSRSRSVDIP
jgi:1-acyl-sn-glycerol-3-phosphate acyltransferase